MTYFDFSEFREDLAYAAKVLGCLFSHYDGLQQPSTDGDGWEEATDADAYYVCASFGGRHIPLPLLISAMNSYCGPLQRAALNFAERAAFSTPFFGWYKAAFIDAAEYEAGVR